MEALDPASLDKLFHEARTFQAWQPRPVPDALIHQLYALTRMGPTSANTTPARFVFVRSPEAKARLKDALMPMNVDKTMSAPVTVIVAADTKFADKMNVLFPARPEMGERLAAMPEAARDAFTLQNASLQAGYLILAARALGLDTGPMGGFDKAKVDAAFFADSTWRTTLLINLGYGDTAGQFPRLPRLDFDTAARIE